MSEVLDKLIEARPPDVRAAIEEVIRVAGTSDADWSVLDAAGRIVASRDAELKTAREERNAIARICDSINNKTRTELRAARARERAVLDIIDCVVCELGAGKPRGSFEPCSPATCFQRCRNCRAKHLAANLMQDRISDWYRVTQRLPTKHGLYWVALSNGGVCVAAFVASRGWLLDDNELVHTVTHWTDLPEHPGKRS